MKKVFSLLLAAMVVLGSSVIFAQAANKPAVKTDDKKQETVAGDKGKDMGNMSDKDSDQNLSRNPQQIQGLTGDEVATMKKFNTLYEKLNKYDINSIQKDNDK